MSEFIEKSKQQIKTYVGYEVPPNESSKLKNHSNSKKAQSIKIKKKSNVNAREKLIF